MDKHELNNAFDKLAEEFNVIEWDRREETGAKWIVDGAKSSLIQMWPGKSDEEIMICVFKGKDIHEPFHRQDFFFLNFAYKGSYGALSEKSDNQIRLLENECYIGRPNANYAINGESDAEIIIIGVLIQRESFIKNYLSLLASDSEILRFFLAPEQKNAGTEYLRLHFDKNDLVRSLLEWMVLKYAKKDADTQRILRPLTVALLLEISTKLKQMSADASDTLAAKILRYFEQHYDNATLGGMAAEFSYHPNYLSAMIKKETGKNFSQLLLEQRMTRAQILIENSPLTISDIAAMLGYTNTSNFHKAYREYYGHSPRQS